MKKPNIVLLIAEELGYDFLAYAGNLDSETPFLDRLAQKSLTFSNHFTVHGKCVPSRGALFSGRYCHNGGHRTLGIELQKNEISLAKILKDNNYTNILVGKNHTVDNSILMDQFDEHWKGGYKGMNPVGYSDYNEGTTSNDRQAGNKHADNYLFGKLNLQETELKDYINTQRTCDFIESQNGDEPFFIDLNFEYTHPPYEIIEPYYSKFMGKDLTLFPNTPGRNKPEFMYKMHELYGFDRLSEQDRKEMLACYYGQLAFVDKQVEKIYNSLQKSGQLNNTIFIFTSDHGDLAGCYGLPEKWDTLFSDKIMKIPLIVHFPEEFSPQKIETMTENIDILPMILELTGITPPYGIQGKSPIKTIQGGKDEHRTYVFAEGGHEKELLDIKIAPDRLRKLIVGYLKKAEMREIYPDSLRKAKMIRSKDYKLVYRIKDRNEFYDLKADPLEMNNIYGEAEYQEIISSMEKTLLNHLIESEENLPFDPNPIS